MSDNEILEKYCKENHDDLEYKSYVKDTYGFCIYLAKFRLNELREDFKEKTKKYFWLYRKYLLYKFDRIVIFKSALKK